MEASLPGWPGLSGSMACFTITAPTGVPTPGDNFYEEIRMLVSRVMAERKFTDEEEFFDPFTQEPVEVLLDPRILAVELSGDHDLDELEKERLINIIDTEARVVSQQNPDESTSKCKEAPVLRSATQVADGECQPETPSNQDGETADGAIDPENGKKIVGYMEFFLREQFKTFNTQQEVCDLLGISVEELIEAFEDKLIKYVSGGDDG